MNNQYRKQDFFGSNNCVYFHNKHNNPLNQLKGPIGGNLNQKMFAEFEKQKQQQADNNKDMAKLIQEQQTKPLKVKHTPKELPVKLNNDLMEEFKQNKKSQKESKPVTEGKNTLDEMRIEPTKKREENKHFHGDDYQDDKKKEMPHYSNVLNRELGERPKKQVYREKLIPSVPYHKYQTSHIRSQRNAQQQQDEEDDNQSKRFDDLKKQLEQNMHQKNEAEIEQEIKQQPKTQGKVVDYRIKGHKYEMKQMTDRDLRSDILNNGFHVVSITIERDPVNNSVNGIFKARLRLNEQNMDLFEDFLKYKKYMILFKKVH